MEWQMFAFSRVTSRNLRIIMQQHICSLFPVFQKELTVLIEAGSFGLPLVSSDTSVREILGNSEYGLVSPIDDFEALEKYYYRIFSDKEMYRKYSDLALEKSKQFVPEVILERVEAFLLNLY